MPCEARAGRRNDHRKASTTNSLNRWYHLMENNSRTDILVNWYVLPRTKKYLATVLACELPARPRRPRVDREPSRPSPASCLHALAARWSTASHRRPRRLRVARATCRRSIEGEKGKKKKKRRKRRKKKRGRTKKSLAQGEEEVTGLARYRTSTEKISVHRTYRSASRPVRTAETSTAEGVCGDFFFGDVMRRLLLHRILRQRSETSAAAFDIFVERN
ncbi:hypothetical protein GW17_00026362 [Ensete ventricosum]|nr:hypothetical protein GW17_00026362 [Ensete ventricosum]